MLALIAAPLLADNPDEPLLMAMRGTFYSKISAGLMFKEVDDNPVNKLKGIAGQKQGSITRTLVDFDYGITDRLGLQLSLGYTGNSKADRSGLHVGRLGAIFRALDSTDPIVWDVYSDFHLGGMTKMEANLSNTPNGTPGVNTLVTQFAMDYKNYTTGQYGIFAGTRVGKTIGAMTFCAFAEVLHKFAADNTEISIDPGLKADLGGGIHIPLAEFVPPTFAVDLDAANDFNAGLKVFQPINDRWYWLASYLYKYHADNRAKSVLLDVLPAAGPMAADIINGLKKGFDGSLGDGYDEHVIAFSLGYMLKEGAYVAGYAEYTTDRAFDINCHNTTNSKYEFGVRINFKF